MCCLHLHAFAGLNQVSASVKLRRASLQTGVLLAEGALELKQVGLLARVASLQFQIGP